VRVKSYFVNRVEDAFARALEDLGEDALLLASKRTVQEQTHLGLYEVVFATSVEPAGPEEKPAIVTIREQLDALRNELSKNPKPAAESPGQLFIRTQLRENGLAAIHAQAIAEALPPRVHTAHDLWRIAAARSLSTKLAQLPPATLTGQLVTGGTAVLIAGPSGRGKTTTLTKLALQTIAQHGTAVRIVCFDADLTRQESLRLIPMQCVGSLREMRDAVTAKFDGLTLIDAPSAPSGSGPVDGLATFCRDVPGIHTALVLRADTTVENLSHIAAQYAGCLPQSVIFTGLDEVHTFGALASLSLLSRIPVAFVCAGTRVPEDMERATPQSLAELAVYGARNTRRSAA
jgi:flagellar biosynthesis protein FlhF